MTQKLKSFAFKNKVNILFISVLLVVSLFYNYHNILTKRPYSMHQWRQADCLSITLNYYMENRSFFEPAINWVGDKDGRTVSECPIIYYSVAKLWKVFGYHECIFRLLNLILVFSGLFCLFRLIREIISDSFWATIITFLLFSSPILVFYSNNFLVDAPAFGLVLIACYFFFIGYKRQRKILYYLSFLFFLLSGLIKVSSLIAFIAVLIIHLYALLFYKKENTWFYKWYSIFPYILVILLVVLWYSFAKSYQQKNLGGIFLTGIYPIWDLDKTTISSIWDNFTNNLLSAYFNQKALFVILSIFILNGINYKKVNKVLFYFDVLIFIGVISFILLFYKALTVHDYYLTNLLIFIPFPLITFIEMLKRNYIKIYKSKILRTFFVIATLMLIYETAVINRMKYSTDDWLVRNNIVLGNSTLEYWKWFHQDYTARTKSLETITPYLRNIGIKRTDRVLSLPDESINVSLYFMDQKGFTGYGYSAMSFKQKLDYFKINGVIYLIADTLFINNQEYIKPYLNYKIGNYRNINIYKLN